MFYAKSLIKLKEYETCLNFLDNFKVLPFEGATEGRNIYHETCIRLSLEAFDKNDFYKAITYAKKAKLWPKNLGVGKHYDVDERLDNYLIAISLNKLNDNVEALEYYEKVAAHKTPNYINESSKLYFQLVVLNKLGNNKLISELKEKYSQKSECNKYIEWAFAKFNKNNTDQLESEISNSNTEIQAYDTKFVDIEFKLVNDALLSILKSKK